MGHCAMVYLFWLKVLKGALAQKTTADLALGAVGVSLAGTSAIFAVYMVANSDQGPRINGAENLALFAQPVSVPYKGAVARIAEPQFDMMPVGSVRPRVAPPAPVASKVVAGYYMRGYSQGAALVQGPDGFFNVKVGAEIDGLGRVIAIEPRGRNLVVITTNGIIAGDD
jgi:hypothetical protein